MVSLPPYPPSCYLPQPLSPAGRVCTALLPLEHLHWWGAHCLWQGSYSKLTSAVLSSHPLQHQRPEEKQSFFKTHGQVINFVKPQVNLTLLPGKILPDLNSKKDHWASPSSSSMEVTGYRPCPPSSKSRGSPEAPPAGVNLEDSLLWLALGWTASRDPLATHPGQIRWSTHPSSSPPSPPALCTWPALTRGQAGPLR